MKNWNGTNQPKFIDRTGEIYLTSSGDSMEIVEYFCRRNCSVLFPDGTIVKNVQYSNIKTGMISNPNTPSLFKVGYMGQGKYDSKSKSYKLWSSIIERCYSNRIHDLFPTYKECSVVKEWHNFQNFARWFEDNYNEKTMIGWQIDKDILLKGNKIYSKETCCFVPNSINSLIINRRLHRGDYPLGVSRTKDGRLIAQLNYNKPRYLGSFKTVEEAFQTYKNAKEKYIIEVANEWKDLITESTYKALINYKIEITD